jgi:YgiT-type zinc finger domain-containing protein
LENEEIIMEKPFGECPVCGGELVEKEVEKLLKGGSDTAVLKVTALICQRCGERLYTEETVRRFEEIRSKLKRHDTADLQPVGTSFKAH